MTQTINDNLQVNGELNASFVRVKAPPVPRGSVSTIASFVHYNNIIVTFTGSGIGIGTTIPGSKLVVTDADQATTIPTTGVSLHAAGSVSEIGFNRNVADGHIYDAAITAWQFTARDDTKRHLRTSPVSGEA